jgi:hypothetical protein
LWKLFKKKRGVISYPKSGRTWLRVMLDELGIEAHYRHAGSGYRTPRHLDSLDTSLADDFSQVVVLFRDPRDTVVSGYYHSTKRLRNFSGDLDAFAKDPRLGIDKVVRFQRLWRERSKLDEKILIVTYEEIHANAEAVILSIADFFGFSPSMEEVRETVANNSFEAMQAREGAGLYKERYGEILLPGSADDPMSFKVRRGKVGGFADEMSEETIKYCENAIRPLSL